MQKYKTRLGAAIFAIMLLGTGCTTYGDFGGGVSLGPVHFGGYIGWGGGGGGSAAPGSNASNSSGGGTATTNTPVQKKSESGGVSTGTVTTSAGAYTGEVTNAPTTSGNVSGTAQNVRSGQY